ncbi:MAG TPA: CsgG/HfaB family protein [Thermoanaerobaculia bacterium]|nr:CsgG/HfaB family protein [Thermoanaerobaculia bacterium]
MRARPGVKSAALLALAIGLAGSQPLRPVELRPAPGWEPAAFPACAGAECRFEGRSGDVYLVTGGSLERIADGTRVYSVRLAERFEKVLLAGISPATNQLVVALARERVSVRGRSALAPGSGIHPKDVEREHRLAVVNPKSGESVKSIDLGPFLPRDLALTEHGEHALLVGEELHLNRRELRIYNTRSGKLEVQELLAGLERVVLAADGVVLGDRPMRLTEEAAGGQRRFASRDPYSIAEYVVECASPLDPAALAGRPFAVVAFDGADSEVNGMLTGALALELRGAGFTVAERERIAAVLDELWLQTTGATEGETAVRLGRLANVRFLVFGSLREAGTTSSLAVRSVGVEQGELAAGCEVTCRDCRRDDYLEALRHLVSVWVAP